jgi:hypothetical protein
MITGERDLDRDRGDLRIHHLSCKREPERPSRMIIRVGDLDWARLRLSGSVASRVGDWDRDLL